MSNATNFENKTLTAVQCRTLRNILAVIYKTGERMPSIERFGNCGGVPRHLAEAWISGDFLVLEGHSIYA